LTCPALLISETDSELGPKKIRVNTISPGIVETEGTHSGGFIGSEFEKAALAQTPLGRIGKPSDIASIAVFLASEDSAWLTGERILASGGFRQSAKQLFANPLSVADRRDSKGSWVRVVKDADGNLIREAPLSLRANFRQRALDLAIGEINKKTDLNIELESIERVKHRRDLIL
jgi:Enoyl-(Acyl carrier protein) reductase